MDAGRTQPGSVLPNRTGCQRIVIVREHVPGNAETHAGVDDTLNVDTINCVIPEHVARDKDRVHLVCSGDGGKCLR